jgi:hypothetical protein
MESRTLNKYDSLATCACVDVFCGPATKGVRGIRGYGVLSVFHSAKNWSYVCLKFQTFYLGLLSLLMRKTFLKPPGEAQARAAQRWRM